MAYDIDALIRQADQVEKQAKERKSAVMDRPLYDVQIPRWGKSNTFKYDIASDKVVGNRLLVVIMGSHNSFLRWGPKSHDSKSGPFCRVKGYSNPDNGEVVMQDNWEIPRPNIDMTLTAYKPFGTRKDPENQDEYLSCSKCREKGWNKSDEPAKFGADECGFDGWLDVVVFRHMVDTEEGQIYKTVDQTTVGQAYLAKLPVTAKAAEAFMNFTFDLARGRRLEYDKVVVEVKIEMEKNRQGAEVAKLDFKEMDPSKPAYKEAVETAHQLFAKKKEEARAKYQEKKNGQNPVPASSSADVPFPTAGGSY